MALSRHIVRRYPVCDCRYDRVRLYRRQRLLRHHHIVIKRYGQAVLYHYPAVWSCGTIAASGTILAVG
ncbi:hypothetical protein SERLA73DRAFT_176670 [Serpula lacrymans var. lacrymans S7.3]|uniref:Uncharacterized protein n=2 Tax=Serpula lacrymans var. lacrymans TaxID=341189 RepID=F8PPI6_SERL3|nr:uncharacterized protein SERLADRAFT_459826 [Serpula lacrymans var. lacrymans S7.9]EGO01405.1 hypothetical protein SERLA73DRAFT_176670 [Serpula lacrymans var. lacrymans S7.3]EGO27039.1 hypothetical protein SERLADRAFT_459826 [Serpula lacrymans var. lacrymans S7.9]